MSIELHRPKTTSTRKKLSFMCIQCSWNSFHILFASWLASSKPQQKNRSHTHRKWKITKQLYMPKVVKTINHYNHAIPHNLQKTKKHKCKEKLSTNLSSNFFFSKVDVICFHPLRFHHPTFMSDMHMHA